MSCKLKCNMWQTPFIYNWNWDLLQLISGQSDLELINVHGSTLRTVPGTTKASSRTSRYWFQIAKCQPLMLQVWLKISRSKQSIVSIFSQRYRPAGMAICFVIGAMEMLLRRTAGPPLISSTVNTHFISAFDLCFRSISMAVLHEDWSPIQPLFPYAAFTEALHPFIHPITC